MVQKYQSPVRVYKYPFELVMLAYERRFPKCPQMPIVLDCEILKDEITDQGAVRNTSRRCKLAVEAPYLFKKLIGLDVVYFIQNNFLDMRSRSLNIEATNETYSSRIEIFERCRYYAHPENPNWTCFDQTATLDIKNFLGFEHSMEKMGMKQYTQTTLKGKEIIEYFIEELKKDGITNVEQWQPSATEETISVPITVATDNNLAVGNVASGGIGASSSGIGIDINKSGNENGGIEGAGISGDESVMVGGTSSCCQSRKPSITEYEDMLDVDYINKYLGQLEPLQESKLLELRELIKNNQNGYRIPTYQTLLRFLRARDFSVEKAANMLLTSLKWRQENRIDEIISEYKKSAVMTKYFPGGWHHSDSDGRPMYIIRLGHMDVKGLLKSIGEDGLLRMTLHICEEGLTLIDAATKARGSPVLSWSLLVDLDGLSMRHLWRPGVKALLHIIETVETNYPETLGRVFIVRAPRVFPIAWTIVSAFIDENTRSKFLFYGGHDCLHMKDGLEMYIDSEVIPEFLGGPCKSLVHEGGLIPKTLYKSMSDEEPDNSGTCSSVGGDGKIVVGGSDIDTKTGESIQPADNSHNSLYKSVDMKPGQIYEVVIRNNDPKSVLTWDFDVVKSDLHYTVYRTMKVVTNVNDLSVSVFDLSEFIEEKNYYRVEPTLVCRSKESVQGSHVMTNTGNYVLQWICPPSCEQPAQLMYFHEILSSVNYKGSMSSLQSGISAMSISSSCQSR